MRHSIVTSIDNFVVTLNSQLGNLQANEAQTTSQIASNPSQAKYLQTVGRQQKVKEALYLFLLQKREENELSKAFYRLQYDASSPLLRATPSPCSLCAATSSSWLSFSES